MGRANNEILTDILAVVVLGIEVVIGLVGVEVEGLILVLVVPGHVSTVILAEREKNSQTFSHEGAIPPLSYKVLCTQATSEFQSPLLSK